MPLLRVDNVGSAGFLSDIEPWQLDGNAWTMLKDVSLSENSILPSYKTSQYLQETDRLESELFLGIFSHNSFGVWWLILCTQTKVYATRGSGLEDITPDNFSFSASQEERWQATSFNGFLLLNNSREEPYYWPLLSDSLDLPKLEPLSSYPGSSAWPAGQTCKFLVAFNSSLFAGNIANSQGVFPYLVLFSDFAEPGTLPQSWEPRPENSAGRRDLADGQDEIVGAKPFKDVLVIRKQTSVYVFRFTGGQFVYQRRVVSDETTCLNKFCIENTDAFQVVIGRNDIYITEGGQHQSVVKNRTKNWFFQNMNQAAREKVFVVYNAFNSEMWFFAPHGDSEYCNVALIWNYLENTFTTRTCNNYLAATLAEGILPEGSDSWDDLGTTVWDDIDFVWGLDLSELEKRRMVFAQAEVSNQEFFTQRLLYGRPTEAIRETDEFYLERMHIPFPRGDVMDWETVKQISYVSPKCRKVNPEFYLDIWLGTQEDIDSPIKWHGPKRWRPGKKNVFFDRSGRFISIKARGPSDIDFRLTGYDIEYKLVSKR